MPSASGISYYPKLIQLICHAARVAAGDTGRHKPCFCSIAHGQQYAHCSLMLSCCHSATINLHHACMATRGSALQVQKAVAVVAITTPASSVAAIEGALTSSSFASNLQVTLPAGCRDMTLAFMPTRLTLSAFGCASRYRKRLLAELPTPGTTANAVPIAGC